MSEAEEDEVEEEEVEVDVEEVVVAPLASGDGCLTGSERDCEARLSVLGWPASCGAGLVGRGIVDALDGGVDEGGLEAGLLNLFFFFFFSFLRSPPACIGFLADGWPFACARGGLARSLGVIDGDAGTALVDVDVAVAAAPATASD
jgi:hypothetical protein